MPVVDVDPEDLRNLVGTDRSDDELLEDMFALGLEFEGWTEDEEFQLEFAPDRLDRLSVEGIARSLRYQYGEDRGVYVPGVNDAEWTIEVKETPEERPYVTGAIVRGLDLDGDALDSLIQLQEKLHATMGRQRAKGAIGVHDLTMLKGAPAREGVEKSITYTGMDPDGEPFVPLESDEELTPREVTERHHMGKDYADLVEGMDRYPAIYDDIGLFSFPPVINGRRTEVTEESRDLLIEMTGTDQWTLDRMCTIVCYSLAARGGRVERVNVNYADGAPGEYAGATLDRPDLLTRTKRLPHYRIESIIGVQFTPEEVIDCIERAGLSAEYELLDDEAKPGDHLVYEVEIPPYRVDVVHPIDIVDDIGRAYGFNELEPRYPDVATVGTRHERSRLEDAAREALVGLGFEDLLNFYMINEEENYERMNLAVPSAVEGSSAERGSADHSSGQSPREDDGSREKAPANEVVGGGQPVTIMEPYSEEYTILRTWGLPSLLMVLENNTHRAYPQHLAEIGLAAVVDESENTNVAEHRTVAGVIAEPGASYEDARARLQVLARRFDRQLETPPTDHPTFIDGRAADVVLNGERVGIVGEIHPRVLVEHDLELPVAAFEFRLDGLR